MRKLNTGLVYSDSNCIGCNKCISVCPVMGANVVADKITGHNVVKVDSEKCIHCGSCLRECTHDVRHFRDDTDRFLTDLKAGKKITLLVAPSMLTNYQDNYNNILGYLKHLGVSHIYNVSFGADITTWAYINYMNSSGNEGMISQTCPVVVNYIEKYEPQLIEKLMPV